MGGDGGMEDDRGMEGDRRTQDEEEDEEEVSRCTHTHNQNAYLSPE
jgi:hypothetical protein